MVETQTNLVSDPLQSGEARLALCGNVFPGDSIGGVLSVLDGPVREWADGLRERGWTAPLGFGLYLGNDAVSDLARYQDKQARLNKSLADNNLAVWTANAFPFGGFHNPRVKEAVFHPDWRQPERVSFTCRVAETLTRLLMPGASASVSTCPLGYGPDAGRAAVTVSNLRRAQEGLLHLEKRTGVKVVLAIEPEPDGCFERVKDLCAWLEEHVYEDTPLEQRRLGVCWDLCHSAVVGEECSEVTTALTEHGIPLGKVQISSAIELSGGISVETVSELERLCGDPYLHQVRGFLRDGRPCSFSDLPKLLNNRAVVDEIESIRVHCHVPVHRTDVAGDLRATSWREALQAAWDFGCRDYELETYTLPILPADFLATGGQVPTMIREMEACALALAECAKRA